jgi:ornithine--oxo-acid transaminase
MELNHPKIIAAIEEKLLHRILTILQIQVPEVAAGLAAQLCAIAGGRLNKVFFTSSACEGIETVIKFSRAHTSRPGFLYFQGAFHGLTYGPLWPIYHPFWRNGFEPFLPNTESVTFVDLNALEERLASKQFAAFMVERVQGEAGISIPPSNYQKDAWSLCHRYGTVFVLEEVQTGMYRTAPFLSAHQFDLDPDMVVLAMVPSGGLIP